MPPYLFRAGAPFAPFGAIQCCLQFEPGGVPRNSRWPLASDGWMEYTKATMFHFRLGPFYGDDTHENEWTSIGGPYVHDGPEFNERFWLEVRWLTDEAGRRGANVEVVVIDTWYCKRASSTQGFGDQQMPWPQADIDACGITPTGEQERYIRKVVRELGCFANVIWMTDNEGDQIRGTRREWYTWVRDVIRDEEQKTGCGVVHLVGTNNPSICGAPFDYCATHANANLLTPIAGRHTENNERSGFPQNSPALEWSRFCEARARGLHYWFWRGEMTNAQVDEALALFQGGCN